MLNNLNIKKIVYGAFALFVCLYFLSAFLSPVDMETLAKYNISVLQLRLISVSVLLPVVGIWVSAAYGFVHFKQYALSIKGSPYGKGINTIANGLGIIALQLLISGMLSVAATLPAVKTALGGDKGVTILNSNLGVAFAILSTILVYIGAGQLLASTPKRTRPRVFTKSFYILVLVSIAYVASVAAKYHSGVAPDTIYAYVPLSIAILFVAIPYVITWQLALLAVKRLYYYRAHVKGQVYKQALGLLTTGFSLIVGSSVLMQLLSTFGEIFAKLQLLPLLIVFYVLIFGIGVGYLYIARSATRLRDAEG